MRTQHIALVPTTDGVDRSELARVSAALQKQVMRDLGPLWGISATVDPFCELEDVPLGYWPVLVSSGEVNHETGRLLDENGQPCAHVMVSPHWSVVASRACLELLVNPFGNRSVVCSSPRYDQGLVQMLVEICAPCEDPSHAYVVNDVLVSDFCTPSFYESDAASAQQRCSFYGSLAAPLRLLIGGHLTWFDSPSDSWWLRTQHEGEPVDTRLGCLEPSMGSVRELVRRYAPPVRRTWTLSYEAFETRARLIREQAALASHARARQLRSLIGRAPDPGPEGFDEVTREFVDADELALGARRLEATAQQTPADERHAPVADDEVAPLELVAPAPGSQPAAAASGATLRNTELSVVASFVLSLPDTEPGAGVRAAQAAASGAMDAPVREPSQPPALAALKPARPEEVRLFAPPVATVDTSRDILGAARPATDQPHKPSSSSIAPPTLALMAPERSREGLDARLLAGAIVLAVLAVLVFTQRRAAPAASAGRPAATMRAAAVADAGVSPAPAPVAAPALVTAPGPVAAPSPAPAEAVAPALREAKPPTRRAARSAASQRARDPSAAPIEELFETRR
jgi:hypothetical protein